MPVIGALTSFTASTRAKAAEVNANFTTVRDAVNNYAVFKDVAATISAVHTYSAAPVFGVGASITTGGLAVAAGGITVTGNSTITGTLGGLTGLTVASGGVAVIAGGVTVTAGNLALSAGQGYSALYDAGNSGTAKTIDWNNGNNQKLALTGNVTLTLSNPQAGASYTLRLTQDGTGGRTVTWPAAVRWSSGTAPTITSTAGKRTVIVLTYDGSIYEASVFGANYTVT